MNKFDINVRTGISNILYIFIVESVEKNQMFSLNSSVIEHDVLEQDTNFEIFTGLEI